MFSHLLKYLFISPWLLVSVANAQTEYIVSVDPSTGIITRIDSIPGVIWIQGYGGYNESAKAFTFIGTKQPGQATSYLHTVDPITGHVLHKPPVSNPNTWAGMQYSRQTGKLYGLIISGGVLSLVNIDKISGNYSVIAAINGLDGISGRFTIDEINQRLYLSAIDHNYNPGYVIRTIDLATGNTINHTPIQKGIYPTYDNNSKKLFGLSSRPGPIPGSYILSLSTVDPVTGVISNIGDIPNITGINYGHETINENDGIYYFVGLEGPPPAFLYGIDINTGSIVSRVNIPTSGAIDRDNLIFFNYDNLTRKMFALFWEAKTVKPPTTTNADSSCRLDSGTIIYYNTLKQSLIINKKVTTCKVALNVYNNVGQILVRSKIITDGANEIPFSTPASGVYYYQLLVGNKQLLSGKFIR